MIDTAGIRKKKAKFMKIRKNILFYGPCVRSIVLMWFVVVLNAEEGIREQDKHVAGYAHEADVDHHRCQ